MSKYYIKVLIDDVIRFYINTQLVVMKTNDIIIIDGDEAYYNKQKIDKALSMYNYNLVKLTMIYIDRINKIDNFNYNTILNINKPFNDNKGRYVLLNEQEYRNIKLNTILYE